MRYRTSAWVLGGILLGYGLLTATHLGEFWPFSIYPMFSSAGNPWTRAIVREVPRQDAERFEWAPAAFEALPGDAYPLEERGVFQNDLANYVSKARDWAPSRVRGVRAMFSGHDWDAGDLVVMRVQGALAGEDSVAITATPLLLLTPDSSYLNPLLQDLPAD